MINSTQFDAKVREFDESTGLTGVWAFCFGFFYFLAHGMIKQAVIVFLVSCTLVGMFVTPFIAPGMARRVWRQRAEERAVKASQIS